MKTLNLLLLEDMVSDAELIILTLERSGLDFTPVLAQGKADFLRAIKDNAFDAILADNSMPQFSASEALDIYNSNNLTIPFILVTGSISEEYAVEIMKKGACDYILKDRLQRLPAAIVSAVERRLLESDKKNYIEKVLANENLLKDAAELANFGSWEADLVTYVQRWSDQQYDILGYLPGEVEPSITNFLKCVHPEDVDFVKQQIDDAFTRIGKHKYDCRLITKDGSVKYVNGEMLVKRDENGKALRINGFIRDVTENINAEIKEQRISADLVQRNQDLEQFAYIVSHNLRAPVANIVGVTNVLMNEQLSEPEKDEFMKALATSVNRLEGIITDLNNILSVRKTINENKEYVDFSEIIDDVKAAISSSLEDNCIMIVEDFHEVPGISSLKSYIHSIFYNLISNSVKFRKADIAPEIEIKSSIIDDKVVITYKDNGIGIDLEKKTNQQIFGLYKRFHPGYAEGKGMGLYMVKTQVETLGGTINVKSKVNEGTEFIIAFGQHDVLRNNLAYHNNQKI